MSVVKLLLKFLLYRLRDDCVVVNPKFTTSCKDQLLASTVRRKTKQNNRNDGMMMVTIMTEAENFSKESRGTVHPFHTFDSIPAIPLLPSFFV